MNSSNTEILKDLLWKKILMMKSSQRLQYRFGYVQYKVQQRFQNIPWKRFSRTIGFGFWHLLVHRESSEDTNSEAGASRFTLTERLPIETFQKNLNDIWVSERRTVMDVQLWYVSSCLDLGAEDKFKPWFSGKRGTFRFDWRPMWSTERIQQGGFQARCFHMLISLS